MNRKYQVATNAVIIILSIVWLVSMMLNHAGIMEYAMSFCMFMSGFCGLIASLFRNKLPHPAKTLDIISGVMFVAFIILMIVVKVN